MTINVKQLLLASVVMMTLAAPAFAQVTTGTTGDQTTVGAPEPTTPPTTPVTAPKKSGSGLSAAEETQRDTNQQNRIEQGLKSGKLSTGEAAKLEKGEAKIDRVEAKDMKNGPMTAQEKAQIQKMQNNESNQINKLDNNNVKGNPNSKSSERMQADVQRNANQEQRIHNGVANGSLTNKEAGSLERGQARTDRQEYRAGKDGHVGAGEQRRIQNRENRQSGKIYNKKHNERRRGGRHGRD